jgi:hypothetical protein
MLPFNPWDLSVSHWGAAREPQSGAENSESLIAYVSTSADGAVRRSARKRLPVPLGTVRDLNSALPAPCSELSCSPLRARGSLLPPFRSILVYSGLLGLIPARRPGWSKIDFRSCLVTFGQSDNAGVTDGSQTQKTASRSSSPFAVAFSSSAVSASV